MGKKSATEHRASAPPCVCTTLSYAAATNETRGCVLCATLPLPSGNCTCTLCFADIKAAMIEVLEGFIKNQDQLQGIYDEFKDDEEARTKSLVAATSELAQSALAKHNFSPGPM